MRTMLKGIAFTTAITDRRWVDGTAGVTGCMVPKPDIPTPAPSGYYRRPSLSALPERWRTDTEVCPYRYCVSALQAST
jgi:hypothetical protein